jgi:peptide/nickel transport system permease protein
MNERPLGAGGVAMEAEGSAEEVGLRALNDQGRMVAERRYRTLVWRKFKRHRMAVLGTAVVLFLLVASFVGPIISPYEVYGYDLERMVEAPSLLHPMGTDDMGRDELTRILAGGRISMSIGLLASVISVVVGSVIGSVAGYYGGKVDSGLMRVTDLMISFPQILLMILFATMFGKNLTSIAAVIGLLGWMSVARLVRASFLSLKQEEFVLAATAVGASSRRIIAFHIYPNAMGPLLVAATLGVAQAIIMESALSYLGLGVQLPIASWGSMLRLAQNQLATATWLSVFPGLLIVITVLSINFIGDGLRDALDPRHLLK